MPFSSPITVRNLKKSFKKLLVLDGIDLTVERGTVLALLGPNGAGKTTTIRILSTLIPPDSGSVVVNGFDVVHQAKSVRRSIGLTGNMLRSMNIYSFGRDEGAACTESPARLKSGENYVEIGVFGATGASTVNPCVSSQEVV